MNVVIYYFSGTGNTKWAVNELCRNLMQENHACTAISIDEKGIVPDESIVHADVVGFAFPIFGANMPNIMILFFKKLQKHRDLNNSKPAFILTTAGFVDGFGPFSGNRYLKSCGFKLLSYVNLKLSNNISTPKLKSKIQDMESINSRLEKSKLVLLKVANCILMNKRYVTNIGPYLLPGFVIRKILKQAQSNCYLSLSVDNKRCIKCMRCVNNCPTQSIAYTSDQFHFAPSCTACMRCYNFCPANAILHFGIYADPEIYKRYLGPTDFSSRHSISG